MTVADLIGGILRASPGTSTVGIEQVFGLEFGSLEKWRKRNKAPADVVALLQIIHTFPWIIYVAADQYRPLAAKAGLLRAGTEAMIENMRQQDLDEWRCNLKHDKE